jgi:hypothetical protein
MISVAQLNRRKSEAIRLAVQETAQRKLLSDPKQFRDLLGAGLQAELNPNLKFQSEDELWS